MKNEKIINIINKNITEIETEMTKCKITIGEPNYRNKFDYIYQSKIKLLNKLKEEILKEIK